MPAWNSAPQRSMWYIYLLFIVLYSLWLPLLFPCISLLLLSSLNTFPPPAQLCLSLFLIRAYFLSSSLLCDCWGQLFPPSAGWGFALRLQSGTCHWPPPPTSSPQRNAEEDCVYSIHSLEACGFSCQAVAKLIIQLINLFTGLLNEPHIKNDGSRFYKLISNIIMREKERRGWQKEETRDESMEKGYRVERGPGVCGGPLVISQCAAFPLNIRAKILQRLIGF